MPRCASTNGAAAHLKNVFLPYTWWTIEPSGVKLVWSLRR